MRNLKKVLALALAVVMLVGMMVVGAGAATYKDDADIDYKTAVEVMSYIKAINGNDGNFNPQGNLSRADAAIIAARVYLQREKADTLMAVATTYSDVAANAYYAGAVAWATNTGILAGDGTGKFNPNNDLNGYAFAKMMLCVLGYDAEIEGYVNNADWAININYDAMMAGLLEGFEGVDLSKPLTREQAALMGFNALQANQVEYAGGSDITIGDITITAGATCNELTTTLAKDTYGIEIKTLAADTPDSIPYTEWYDGVTAIAGTQEYVAPSMTLTTATKLADLTKLGYTVTATNNADIEALSGNGVTLQLYINAAKEIYTVVESHEKLDVVTGVKTDRDGNVVRVTLASSGTFNAANAETKAPATPGFAELVELGVEVDDIVLVNTVDGAFDSVIGVPEMVSGKVSKKDAKGVTMDGAELTYAKNHTTSVVLGKNNYAFLDTNGYVLSVAEVPNVVEPKAPNYLLITETWKVIDNSTKADDTLHFSGITMDGTVIEDGVYVPGMKNTATAPAKNYVTLWSKATVDTDGNVTAINIDGDETAEELEILVSYSVNEKTGVYTFTDKVWDAETTSVVNDTIIAGGVTGTDLVGNETVLGANFFASNVQFVFAYENVPGQGLVVKPSTKEGVQETTDNYYVFTTEDAEGNDIITRVFVLGAPVMTPPPVEYVDGIYYIGNVSTDFNYYTVVEDGDKLITLGNVTAFVDGEKTDLDFIVKAVAGGYALDAESPITAGFYKVEMGKHGEAKLTGIVAATMDDKNTANPGDDTATMEVVSGSIDGYVKLVNGKYYIAVDGGTYYNATEALVLDLTETGDHVSLGDLYTSANHDDTTTLNVTVLRNATEKDNSVVAIVVTAFAEA